MVIGSFPEAEGYIIGWSGGKDSACLMDITYHICKARNMKLSAFMMSFLPNMDYFRVIRQYAERRWDVKVHEYTHWGTHQSIRQGLFRPLADPSIPRITIKDIEAMVREETGLHWIGMGFKSIDSLQRRGMMNSWPNGVCEKRGIFAPLKNFNHSDIKRYLASKRICPPMIEGARVNGIDLSPVSMKYLRDYWPNDYRRVLDVFPLAIAQADRA